jgi:hypothetical protein
MTAETATFLLRFPILLVSHKFTHFGHGGIDERESGAKPKRGRLGAAFAQGPSGRW